jgi:hypothetical protein
MEDRAQLSILDSLSSIFLRSSFSYPCHPCYPWFDASGRRGSRTLISRRRTALAKRPGQPYPAALRNQWTHRESNPDLQSAGPASSRWTTGPIMPTTDSTDNTDEKTGAERVDFLNYPCHPCYPWLEDLRRPDLNRRRTAYETVLEPLQSTPQ